jgi:hypothetical protein
MAPPKCGVDKDFALLDRPLRRRRTRENLELPQNREVSIRLHLACQSLGAARCKAKGCGEV